MMTRADLKRLIAEELSIALTEASAWRIVRIDRLKPGDTAVIDELERVVKSVRRRFERVQIFFTDGDPFEPEEFELTQRVQVKRGSSSDASSAAGSRTVTLFGPPEVGAAGVRRSAFKQKLGKFGML